MSRYPYGTLIEIFYPSATGDIREILTVEDAVKRQRASVSKLGMHYTNDEDAIMDYMVVHWAKVCTDGTKVGLYHV